MSSGHAHTVGLLPVFGACSISSNRRGFPLLCPSDSIRMARSRLWTCPRHPSVALRSWGSTRHDPPAARASQLVNKFLLKCADRGPFRPALSPQVDRRGGDLGITGDLTR